MKGRGPRRSFNSSSRLLTIPVAVCRGGLAIGNTGNNPERPVHFGPNRPVVNDIYIFLDDTFYDKRPARRPLSCSGTVCVYVSD